MLKIVDQKRFAKELGVMAFQTLVDYLGDIGSYNHGYIKISEYDLRESFYSLIKSVKAFNFDLLKEGFTAVAELRKEQYPVLADTNKVEELFNSTKQHLIDVTGHHEPYQNDLYLNEELFYREIGVILFESTVHKIDDKDYEDGLDLNPNYNFKFNFYSLLNCLEGFDISALRDGFELEARHTAYEYEELKNKELVNKLFLSSLEEFNAILEEHRWINSKKVKCIVAGHVNKENSRGTNSFYCINGDIETNAAGEEIYITSVHKEGTLDESEDVSEFVKNMPREVQEYIKGNKRYIKIS